MSGAVEGVDVDRVVGPHMLYAFVLDAHFSTWGGFATLRFCVGVVEACNLESRTNVARSTHVRGGTLLTTHLQIHKK